MTKDIWWHVSFANQFSMVNKFTMTPIHIWMRCIVLKGRWCVWVFVCVCALWGWRVVEALTNANKNYKVELNGLLPKGHSCITYTVATPVHWMLWLSPFNVYVPLLHIICGRCLSLCAGVFFGKRHFCYFQLNATGGSIRSFRTQRCEGYPCSVLGISMEPKTSHLQCH